MFARDRYGCERYVGKRGEIELGYAGSDGDGIGWGEVVIPAGDIGLKGIYSRGDAGDGQLPRGGGVGEMNAEGTGSRIVQGRGVN